MVLPQEVEIIFKIIYAVEIAVNIAGNSLVCFVVRRFPFMKTPMNYLLVHLAICDMLGGILFLPRRVFWGLYDHPSGLLGDFLCKCLTGGSLAWLPSCAGVFMLIIVAWERYNAIMKPYSQKFSNKKIKIAAVLCWTLATIITLWDLIVMKYNSTTKSCDYRWMTTWGAKVDFGIWLFTVGFLPSLIMLSLYGRVIRTLWCSRNTVADVSQRSLLKSRKRVTRTVVTITIILFACWVPSLLYYFISSFMPQKSSTQDNLDDLAPLYYRISYVLLLLNSSINPFIYALQDVRFRTCMKRLLCQRFTRRHCQTHISNTGGQETNL